MNFHVLRISPLGEADLDHTKRAVHGVRLRDERARPEPGEVEDEMGLPLRSARLPIWVGPADQERAKRAGR